MKEHNMLI